MESIHYDLFQNFLNFVEGYWFTTGDFSYLYWLWKGP